jgi:hypothetical protein
MIEKQFSRGICGLEFRYTKEEFGGVGRKLHNEEFLVIFILSRLQWPRCLRHELSSLARTLGS